jgi:heme A synthase
MVVTLLGQLLLGMANTFWLQLPDSGSGWKAAAPEALFMAHMTLGAALLVLAIWIAIAAFRGRDRNWLIASMVGVLGILLAVGAGTAFMSHTNNDGASYLMSIGTSLAIAAYALGLYRIPIANNV